MKIFNKIIICLALIVLLGSCSRGVVFLKTTKSNPFDSDAKLLLNWNDFVYLGDAVGTISYTKYAWGTIIYHEAAFNNRTQRNFMLFDGRVFIPVNGQFSSRALYNALEKYEDYDFVVPVQKNIEETRMFLGKKVKFTVKARVYKFKQNK